MSINEKSDDTHSSSKLALTLHQFVPQHSKQQAAQDVIKGRSQFSLRQKGTLALAGRRHEQRAFPEKAVPNFFLGVL
jgi:hypothetical protein